MYRSFIIFTVLIFTIFPLVLQGQDTVADLIENLRKIPRPWKLDSDKRSPAEESYDNYKVIKPIKEPSFEEYAETLKYWDEKYACLDVQERSRNTEGDPVFLVKITDKSVPDDAKNTILISSFDSGGEKTGAMTALKFIEYLIGNSSDAVETIQKHIVLIMPVVNPYGYRKTIPVNPAGINIYTGNRGAEWDIAGLKLKNPEKVPELAAYISVMNEFKPEVHIDLHGFSRSYNGRIMKESTGAACSNSALHPWDSRICDVMDAEGISAGFGYYRYNRDPQYLLSSSQMAPIRELFYPGENYFYSAFYGYAKYHTIPLIMEVGWETSGVERLKGLIKIGNGKTKLFHEGYPVKNTKSDSSGYTISAWGKSPSECRKSRVELWGKSKEISIGSTYPLYEGREMFFCLIGKQGIDEFFGQVKPSILIKDKAAVIANFRNIKYLNSETLEQFSKMGPENLFWFESGKVMGAETKIENGLALLFSLPYRSPEILDIRLNGFSLKEDKSSGFEKWFLDGLTYIKINVPPEIASKQNVFIVTCAYNPKETRTMGWQAPDEVKSKLRGSRK